MENYQTFPQKQEENDKEGIEVDWDWYVSLNSEVPFLFNIEYITPSLLVYVVLERREERIGTERDSSRER